MCEIVEQLRKVPAFCRKDLTALKAAEAEIEHLTKDRNLLKLAAVQAHGFQKLGQDDKAYRTLRKALLKRSEKGGSDA